MLYFLLIVIIGLWIVGGAIAGIILTILKLLPSGNGYKDMVVTIACGPGLWSVAVLAWLIVIAGIWLEEEKKEESDAGE